MVRKYIEHEARANLTELRKAGKNKAAGWVFIDRLAVLVENIERVCRVNCCLLVDARIPFSGILCCYQVDCPCQNSLGYEIHNAEPPMIPITEYDRAPR